MQNQIKMKFLFLLMAVMPISALAGKEVFFVEGMTCPFCTYGVEKKLLEIPKSKEVDIDLDSGKVILTTKKDHHIKQEQIRRAVQKAGFSVKKFQEKAKENDK